MAQHNFTTAENPFEETQWWVSLAQHVNDIPPEHLVIAACIILSLLCITKRWHKALATTVVLTVISVAGFWLTEEEAYCTSYKNCSAGDLLITRSPHQHCDMDKPVLTLPNRAYSCTYIGYTRSAK